jgi:hypothetical protein
LWIGKVYIVIPDHILARVGGKQLDEISVAFFVQWEEQHERGDEPSRLQAPQVQADHAYLVRDSPNDSGHQHAGSSGSSAQL